jgi:hypothetical protein
MVSRQSLTTIDCYCTLNPVMAALSPCGRALMMMRSNLCEKSWRKSRVLAETSTLLLSACPSLRSPRLTYVSIIRAQTHRQFHDITELLELCIHNDLDNTAMVLNDQLGRGRSTNAAVIVLLIQRWLMKGRWSQEEFQAHEQKKKRSEDWKTSWQIINSCLRVIRNGLEVKRVSEGQGPRGLTKSRRSSTRPSTELVITSTCVMPSKTHERVSRRQRIRTRRRNSSRKVIDNDCPKLKLRSKLSATILPSHSVPSVP